MTSKKTTRHAPERHRVEHLGWLRAAVLGANDGLVSTASLVVGVAAADPSPRAVLLAGVAGLTAGALSMAAGEFISVSSQADTESAEIVREGAELAAVPEQELAELAAIYRARGLTPELAQAVAEQLTARDALGAHLRDELGMTEISAARPMQAALASAVAFAVGAALPVAVAAFVGSSQVIVAVGLSSVAGLAALGALAAQVGGASKLRGALRVVVWGVVAMAVTALVGLAVGRVA